VTTRRLFGPVVAIHGREDRIRSTPGPLDPGPELTEPADEEELPGDDERPAAEDPLGEEELPGAEGIAGTEPVVAAGTWGTGMGSGTLAGVVVAIGGAGSVGTEIGTVIDAVETVIGVVTVGVETVTVGTSAAGTVCPSARLVSRPAPSSRIVAAAALIHR